MNGYTIHDCYHLEGYTDGLDEYLKFYGEFSALPSHVKTRYIRWRVDYNGCTIAHFYLEEEAEQFVKDKCASQGGDVK